MAAGSYTARDAEKYSWWLIDVKEDLAGSESQPISYTICRVPDRLRINSTNDAFSPQIISIGPFHYREKHLQAMDLRKKQYTLSLLHRTHDEMDALEACCHTTKVLEDETSQRYEGAETSSVPDFAKMLLYDGCFILELFIRFYKSDVRFDDPILPNPHVILMLLHDLALLENQIPFVVLDKLFGIITSKYKGKHALPSLLHLALRFFKLDPLTYHNHRVRDLLHLLDLIHDFCRYSSSKTHPLIVQEEWRMIKPATKLSSESGIRFKRAPEKSLFDLKFDDNSGVMIIPQLFVEKSVFQNLIALEQCLPGREQYMTSYGLLMDYLIDTPEDAELLVQKGIVPHDFGDYKEVADLFNNICKRAVVRNFYYAGICNKVDAYCQSNLKYRKHWRSLQRDYCKNPWTVLGIVAAALLFILTLLQTIYTMKG